VLRAAAVFIVLGLVTTTTFVWSTYRGAELEMARSSIPWFVLASAAATVAGRHGALPLVKRLVSSAVQNPERQIKIIVFAVLVALLFNARWVLDAFLNSGDEYAYYLQASTYALGRLWVDAPSPESAFELMRFLPKDGKWLSVYQPAWGLILAGPVALGIPVWVVNPLLGALTTFVFFRLARRLMRVEAAVLATLGLCTSAFFLLNFASLFNHGPSALAGLVFALCGVGFFQSGDKRLALLAGVSLGALGSLRAPNAVVLVIPFVVAVLMTRKRWLGLVWMGLGGLPFAILLLGYNKLITGDPLLLVQNWLLRGSEPIGAPSASSLVETAKRLARLLLWTSPAISIGWPVAFLAVARRRQLSFVDWLAPFTVIAFAFYGGEGGAQYGPRYYFEGWSFALLTVGKAIEPIFSAGARRAEWLAAAVLAHLSFQLGYLGPRALREHRIVIERQGLYAQVAEAKLENAVVLVLDDVGHTRPMPPRDLVRNGLKVGDEPVTYALDKDDATTQVLRDIFPKRRFYRYYRGQLHDALDGQGRFLTKPPGFW
jgi:Dolichyl-phosphate-mannose-protein mannosyltransferase